MSGASYILCLHAISLGTPVLGTVAGLVYTAHSGNRRPLWITLPLYLILHLATASLSLVGGSDFDYLKYDRAHSASGATLYYLGDGPLSFIGLSLLLGAGIRRARRFSPRGFDILPV